MPTPANIKQYQYSDSINRRYWDQNYWFDNFKVNPTTSKVGGGAATGTAGDNNVLFTQFGQYEWNVIGTQTILAPKAGTVGLNLVQDVTNGDGIELCTGVTALSPNAFTIGESPAFFFQTVFTVQDVSGVNPLIIGFRKLQAFDATLANYTDFAAIGIVGTAAKIQTETQLNTGGVVTTDSTQTVSDATAFQLKVKVSASGVVTYEFNYQEPTVVAAFTFDDGDIVIPFIRMVESTDLSTSVDISWFEVGFQT